MFFNESSRKSFLSHMVSCDWPVSNVMTLLAGISWALYCE